MTMNIVADTDYLEKVEAVAGELAALQAEGVKVAVTASDLVIAEEAGLVVDIETGDVVDPVFPVDHARR